MVKENQVSISLRFCWRWTFWISPSLFMATLTSPPKRGFALCVLIAKISHLPSIHSEFLPLKNRQNNFPQKFIFCRHQSSGANFSLLAFRECAAAIVFDEFIPILLMEDIRLTSWYFPMPHLKNAGFHRCQVVIAGFLNHQQYHNKTRSGSTPREQRKKPSYFLLYWLFHRDPYTGLS